MPLTHANAFSKLDEIADTALIQLVYVSSLTLASRLNAAIFDEIEAHARDYNEQHSITGTLCYGNGHFLQCIEGEKAKVAALTQRIFADHRHKHVEVLLLGQVSGRRFADWRMRLLFFGALALVACHQASGGAVVTVSAICAAWLVA
ncbi:MAG: BLUF domain-containing protein [Psychrobacter celer]|uniref:BLUF domain-containing protein n=1 Tax=Psychrobacter celer TaxID=306572 RepID=UPI003FB72942